MLGKMRDKTNERLFNEQEIAKKAYFLLRIGCLLSFPAWFFLFA